MGFAVCVYVFMCVCVRVGLCVHVCLDVDVGAIVGQYETARFLTVFLYTPINALLHTHTQRTHRAQGLQQLSCLRPLRAEGRGEKKSSARNADTMEWYYM